MTVYVHKCILAEYQDEDGRERHQVPAETPVFMPVVKILDSEKVCIAKFLFLILAVAVAIVLSDRSKS